MTLDEYAVACVQGMSAISSQERTMAAIQGLLGRAYYELAIGQDDRYAGSNCSPAKFTTRYQTKVASLSGASNAWVCRRSPTSTSRCSTNCSIRNRDLPYAARAVIRTQLRLPPETVSTNAPPRCRLISTNAPEAVGTNIRQLPSPNNFRRRPAVSRSLICL